MPAHKGRRDISALICLPCSGTNDVLQRLDLLLQVAKAEERSKELSLIVNDFILRRTNSLLSAHLPPKVTALDCLLSTNNVQVILQVTTGCDDLLMHAALASRRSSRWCAAA